MANVVLSTKDADLILSYIREQLEQEDKDWKEYQNDKVEIIKKYEENSIVKMFINKEEIDEACEKAEEFHKALINKLTKFVELLTIGTKE